MKAVKKIIWQAGVILFLAVVFSGGEVLATGSGAYRVEAPDAGPMGMGSAFVAQADRPSAVYYNPAGLVQLKGKRHVSLGTAVIQPFASHTATDGTKTNRRRQRFIVPHFYYVDDFGLENFSFGLGAGSYWGLGTEWAEDSFSRGHSAQAGIETQTMSMAAAYQFNQQFSVGVAVDFTQAKARRKRIAASFPLDNAEVLLKLRDNATWGGRLGLHYKPNPRHSFGLMYRSPVQVEYKGRIYFDNLALGIFGVTSYNTRVTTKSTLPQSAIFGYAYRPNPRWTFEANVEWMNWSSTKHELLIFPEETDPTWVSILNDGNPVPRNWDDAISAAFGVEFKANPRLRLRAGYYYHQTPIPGSTLESSLPDADSHSPTIGFGYDFNDNSTFDFAYSAMFYRKRDLDNNIDSGNLVGRYETFVNIYMATFTYSY